MKGSCLCGTVEYKIDQLGPLTHLSLPDVPKGACGAVRIHGPSES
jgi:hypothetical protein